ncbi:restriction endonuclease subunit S [Bacteroides caccae]|uniref:restriction endonuclease subunit S n=2 Tax=Bacteroidales TaxID=171549 RepID=UPI00321AFF97
MDTKKLRQKILNLAIHGKLVPQDPNDEPASVLLERIKAEKERLIKEGKIKRSKKPVKTSDTPHYENVPFEVPSSWVWTTVNDISKSILYGVSESAKSEGKYKLLRITDIQNNQVDWGTVPFTDFDEDKVSSYILHDGDIVFARTGATVGKSYLIDGLRQKAIYASYLIRVQTFDLILPEYVKLFFESGYYWGQIELGSVGIGQPNVNGTILGNLNIPLPPLVEQQRIVAEIKKWFALIDQIEQGKTDLQTTIKQTKSKILDLAIHGKLVPQDPNDEPAIELLKRINPGFTPCDNGHYPNFPFDIPKKWNWVTLGEIGKWQSGSTPSRLNKDYYNGDIPWLKTGDLNDGYITHIPEYITEKALNETSVKLNPTGSILMAMYGATIGKLGILTYPATTNQACCACEIYTGIEKEFLFYFLLSHRVDFIKLGGGGAQPNISKEKIINTYIPLPPSEEQKRIVNAVNDVFAQLDVIMESL